MFKKIFNKLFLGSLMYPHEYDRDDLILDDHCKKYEYNGTVYTSNDAVRQYLVRKAQEFRKRKCDGKYKWIEMKVYSDDWLSLTIGYNFEHHSNRKVDPNTRIIYILD
jgi:hypothetical protein